jgi:hypothetical protein
MCGRFNLDKEFNRYGELGPGKLRFTTMYNGLFGERHLLNYPPTREPITLHKL